jgi:hypothetical protein
MEKSTHGVLFSSGEVPAPILSVVSDALSGHETEQQGVKTIGASALRVVSYRSGETNS